MAFAILALIALLPVFVVVAIAVKLDSSGPVLFRQERLGRDMRVFKLFKFRTMHADSTSELHQRYIRALVSGHPQGTAGLHKLQDDPRVTPVGRFLRRFSLDELPQLLNVVTGSMSLIGPRPALAYELEHYRPEHFERFSVRPGLTGLWQVSGRSRLDFIEMLDLDVEYARRCSLLTDVTLFALTPFALFRGSA